MLGGGSGEGARWSELERRGGGIRDWRLTVGREVHKQKYMLAGIFLILSLISFVVSPRKWRVGWKGWMLMESCVGPNRDGCYNTDRSRLEETICNAVRPPLHTDYPQLTILPAT